MELNTINFYTSFSFLLLVFLTYKLLFYSSKNTRNLPPSPPSLPIIGHLHLIKPPIHRAFLKLSHKYGPIISLNLGVRRVVVVSSTAAVQECFTKNDVVLANRPSSSLSKHLSYDYTAITSSPYGDHWRNLRRIGTIEVFSTHRLNMFLSFRKDEIERLMCELFRKCHRRDEFAEVELRPMLSNLTFNVIVRMVAGKQYTDDDNSTNREEARQFKELIREVMHLGVEASREDFIPILKWVNGGRIEKKILGFGRRSNKFLQGLINEQRTNKKINGVESHAMIDQLLTLQESEPDYYTDEIIKGLILVFVIAGTDSSSLALEWAMTNLVNHPEVLDKAKRELDSQVGHERLVEESDFPKLNYLHNIILETLRLCPTAPLLVPHLSSQDCTIGGYDVPKDTVVMVNAWAIHRDPSVWDEPTEFKPERHSCGAEHGYKLVPFGAGRRACPGEGLAHRVMGLTLGCLIQCFEWKRKSEELVDMVEAAGISMPKANPLVALYKPRDNVDKILSCPN